MAPKSKLVAPYQETMSMGALRKKYDRPNLEPDPLPKELRAKSDNFGKAAMALMKTLRRDGTGNVHAIVAVFPTAVSVKGESSKFAGKGHNLLTEESESNLKQLSDQILKRHILVIPIMGAEPKKVN